jgi:hypothetical protein
MVPGRRRTGRRSPFLQVTRLYLSLNLKTAKSLGPEFPATGLGSTDFIIE